MGERTVEEINAEIVALQEKIDILIEELEELEKQGERPPIASPFS